MFCSNSKQKRETQSKVLSKKKKIILTGESMENCFISEEGFSVNHKVKIVNFRGGASEKILEKLDSIMNESQTIS